STLWGNGQGLTNQTPASGTNNPCPSGFRVPTQHEWALLGSEGGSSTSADDDSFYTSDGTSGTTSTSGLVWIPVKNGVPSTDWTSGTSDGTSNYPDLSGYALYTSDTWNGIANKTSLIDPEDPEPLMFLPAAGSRNYGYGRMYSAGDYGNYWSSTVGSISYYGQQVGFNSNYVNMTYGNYRTVGMSVRCISE
ncbi:MAG: fibrobacter succinogenes major paralogous domain-containing protein, partial [Dysgonamonadaceae bacterium]|nr:fibrobacter succinogenes major paralogous domain-containing protein [Dysgonamonadaceae bacterium]